MIPDSEIVKIIFPGFDIFFCNASSASKLTPLINGSGDAQSIKIMSVTCFSDILKLYALLYATKEIREKIYL